MKLGREEDRPPLRAGFRNQPPSYNAVRRRSNPGGPARAPGGAWAVPPATLAVLLQEGRKSRRGEGGKLRATLSPFPDPRVGAGRSFRVRPIQ